jgi:hypothetical protein
MQYTDKAVPLKASFYDQQVQIIVIDVANLPVKLRVTDCIVALDSAGETVM